MKFILLLKQRTHTQYLAVSCGRGLIETGLLHINQNIYGNYYLKIIYYSYECVSLNFHFFFILIVLFSMVVAAALSFALIALSISVFRFVSSLLEKKNTLFYLILNFITSKRKAENNFFKAQYGKIDKRIDRYS